VPVLISLVNVALYFRKKFITLTLSDEELMELQWVLLDEDRKAALRYKGGRA